MTVKKSASLKCAKLSAAPRFGNRFSHLTKLGSGTFGEVWKSYDTELERWVAIKRFQDVYSSHLGINMMVIREISLLRKLSHPNIAKTLDVLMGKKWNKESILLVMELEDTDLYAYQRDFRNELDLPSIQFIVKQILEACCYMHSNHVMHRDLKPDNILLCRTSKVVRVSDLGYARTFTHSITATACSVKYSWPIQVLFYKAPEVLLGCDRYSSAVDVWSIGCMLGELLCGGRKLFGETVEDPTVEIGKEGETAATTSKKEKRDALTEIASLQAMFQLLGYPSVTLAPGLRMLPHYEKYSISTLQPAVSSPDPSATLFMAMDINLRSPSAAQLLPKLLCLDQNQRIDCFSALTSSEFFSV